MITRASTASASVLERGGSEVPGAPGPAFHRPSQPARHPQPDRQPQPARPPAPRGPISERLLQEVLQPVHTLVGLPSLPAVDDPLSDEDLNLALYLCYELHYLGLPGVDEGWEWEPSLLGWRQQMERSFLDALFQLVDPPGRCDDVSTALAVALARGSGPSLSGYLATRGSLGEFRELAVHRSAYQLKEADPHTWALPRLTGRGKAALVTIQLDEYGLGDQSEMHSTLFAGTMSALGLDPAYGTYLDNIPGVTLATVNLVSFLGLHRRWRGALVGHLAIFEMASVGPNTAYGDGLRRLGLGSEATRFYDVHVMADAVHQVVAVEDLAEGLVQADPAMAGDIAFGARAIMATEERFSRHILEAWAAGRSSLCRPLCPGPALPDAVPDAPPANVAGRET